MIYGGNQRVCEVEVVLVCVLCPVFKLGKLIKM